MNSELATSANRACRHGGSARRLALALAVLTAVIAVAAPATPAAADGNEAVGAPRAALSLSAGFAHTCVLLDDGSVTCWGRNPQGELGQGNVDTIGDQPGEVAALPPIDLGSGRTATTIAAGGQHTCALLDDGTLKCWGFGSFGRLGYEDPSNRGNDPGEMGDDLPTVDLGTGRTATAITAGNLHTCAILDNGTVKCWGNNTGGRLGYGDTAHRGLNPGDMGDSLPTVDLGTGRTATAISAGETFTCALLDGGDVKCWGANTQGQLGYGDTVARGSGPDQMGDDLPTVDLGTGHTATALTVGDFHACALLDDGSAKCWGWNSSGRLGYGDTVVRGSGPDQMGDDLPAVGVGTGRFVTSIAAGDSHTCVVLDDATGRCWGGGDLGQVGHGNTANIGDTAGQMGDDLAQIDLGTGRTAAAITAGEEHACAILDDATVTCWGEGADGKLGNGATDPIGDGPGEMGDNLTSVPLGGPVAAAAMTATLTRTPATVIAGSPITHTVIITNTGHQPLTGVAVTLPGATCTSVPGAVALEATTTSTCTLPTTDADIPSVTRAATITTTNTVLASQLSAVTTTVATTVTAATTTPTTPTHRPDALVRVGKKPFVGNDVYNRTGEKQTVKGATAKKPVRYTVRVQNDGNAPDTLRVKGTRSSKTFTVTYKAGTNNITKQATKGTYRVRNLAPGASRLITITVTPKKTTKIGAKTPTKVTITSTTDTTKTDTVKTITRRR